MQQSFIRKLKEMKKIKITYWVTTALIAIMMSFSAFSYLGSNEMQKEFQHLGFPGYFRIELAFAKILGVIILVISAVPGRLKEWAYSGFTIVFISAFIAHLSAGEGIGVAAFPLVILILLSVSYISYHKLRTYSKINEAYK